MKIISLGGIGGCDLATALRHLNQLTHPYDWLITTQTFIINTFNNFENFFNLNEKYVYHSTVLLDKNKKAIMLHDFNNFVLQKNEVIAKYQRRFERLNKNLNSNDNILFVRIYDNLEEELIPNTYYDSILIRDHEDIKKWEEFIFNIQNKYNNDKIKLLIITNKEDLCYATYDNIILRFTKEHKSSKAIYDIIQDTITTLFNKT
jgi:hypothetical protein